MKPNCTGCEHFKSEYIGDSMYELKCMKIGRVICVEWDEILYEGSPHWCPLSKKDTEGEK